MDGHVPFESVSAGKHSPTVFASVVAFLHMNTLSMPLQICLAHKPLGAVCDLARKWIFSLLAVRLHMCFEIVTAAKEFATTFDIALEVGFLFGRELPRRAPWAFLSARRAGWLVSYR